MATAMIVVVGVSVDFPETVRRRLVVVVFGVAFAMKEPVKRTKTNNKNKR